MRRKLTILFLLCSCQLFAQTKKYTIDNVHSHNDYEQPAPFWTAYKAGAGSVEADIFLRNDSLLVAHQAEDLWKGRTLEQYYLVPLTECIKKNKGYVFADKSKKLQLLIDIKSEAVSTLKRLIETIRKYPDLTRSKSLVFSISGNRPEADQFKTYPHFISFDGILSQNYAEEELKKISMLSDNIANYVHGNDVTNEELIQLQAAVKKAHSLNKHVRFWGTPDNIETWKKLMALKVDYLNTDHINAIADFIDGNIIAAVGKPLPAWKQGFLDLHHINTGRGNVAYYIFPDSTTMLFDAGEENPLDARTNSARNSIIHPNNSKRPYEWIAHYIKQVSPFKDAHLDYAAISHFHEDHFGGWYENAPQSKKGKYVLSGITGVGELIPIHHFLDRGYPSYDEPVPFEKMADFYKWRNSNYYKTMQNYFAFIKSQQREGMVAERFKAGTKNQIVMRHHASLFPTFFVQQVKSNGDIWTGKDSATLQHFPSIDPGNPKTWPDENPLSLVFTINYGPFVYYTGGDAPGNIFYGDAPWRDVETPVAKAIGSVDVATMDHHGNRDAVNEFQIKTFQPTAWIEQVWSSDHPGHEVLIRLTTPYLNKTPKDLFATNMLEANRLVIGELIDRSYKSQQGHIVVRVLPGGNDYYIIILDDNCPEMPVKKVFGPYRSKYKVEEKNNIPSPIPGR